MDCWGWVGWTEMLAKETEFEYFGNFFKHGRPKYTTHSTHLMKIGIQTEQK